MKKQLTITLLIMLVFALTACTDKQNTNDVSDNETVEWVAADDTIDQEGMNVYEEYGDIQFAGDENAKLFIYVDASANENGEFLFDDQQEWLVVLETTEGNYPLYPRQAIQLGKVSCVVYNEYVEDGIISHILITETGTASYKISDFVFDADKKEFMVKPVYDAPGINLIVGY